jgi:hypothetical protein
MKKIKNGIILDGTLTGLRYYFFQVIEVKGNFCVVREVNEKSIKRLDKGWREYVRPIKNSFKNDKTFRRKIRVNGDWEFIKLERTHYYLSPWDGEDKFNDYLD